MGRIHRALLSVSDKTGVVELAAGLAELGIDLISTGGTARALREAGLTVTDVSEVTGFPEMMDGRVKTLHPKIHGGILARRDVPEHMVACREHDIVPIGLVVVNLYPFKETIANPEVTFEEAIEQIDIGGPTLLRSAAKNHADVTVVCIPSLYPQILNQLRQNGGSTLLTTRKILAMAVFRHTSRYDAAIANYLEKQNGSVAHEPDPNLIDAYEQAGVDD